MTIREIYEQIRALENFKPSRRVNKIFSNLVDIVLNGNDPIDLTSYEITQLQKICARAEYELELFWAKRILSSSDPLAEMSKFPYIENYKKLVKLEYSCLQGCSAHIEHKAVFVGGGPLPLTSIVLAMDYSVKSTVVDSSNEACQLAQRVVNAIGLNNQVSVKLGKGEQFDYKNFNVIFLASLAGVDVNKKNQILNRIATTSPKNAHILVRSSEGRRVLLYPRVDEFYSSYFKPALKVNPLNEVVNSFLIYQKI